MNLLIELKTQPSLFRLVLCLACFGLVPLVEAVLPPPDGGYPGGNTAEGQNALFSRTTGGFNTAVGLLSLLTLTEASFNTGVGAGTLLANIADENTAIGAGALLSNTTGSDNTATGAFALFSNTGRPFNTAVGHRALFSNTTGNSNTATGPFALFNNTGSGNTANGSLALLNNTTGGGNIALGVQAGSLVTTASGVICIGHPGANIDTSCFIDRIRGVTTANADAIPVLIDSNGQLGTASSSRRSKTEIKRMDNASEAILALKPVTFHYKSDSTGTPQFGLIAEEVAEVNPDLVVRDKNGEIYTVRYDAVNAMLLNEFLKEHCKVEEQNRRIQEQETTIAQLKKQMGTVVARLKEQDSKIQRVGAQIELGKTVGQTALNKP